MAQRNPSDLDREQRGSSNPNQTERPEDRSTQSTETGMGGASKSSPNQAPGRNQGVGNESEDRGQGNVGSNREGGDRPAGNIEGDENLNRR